MGQTYSELQASVQHHLGDFSVATRNRVRQWLNDSYEEVWELVPGKHKNLTDYVATTEPYESATNRTVAISEGGTALTSDGSSDTVFTSAMVGRYVQIDGTEPWYKISALVSVTELTLEDAYVGDDVSEGDFKVHTHRHSIASNVSELMSVYAELEAKERPLELITAREALGRWPQPLRWEGDTPSYAWLDDKDSSGNHTIGLYPVPESKVLLRYRYRKSFTALSADDDTIDIPGGTAAVLQRTLATAYAFRRKVQTSTYYYGLYETALNRLVSTVRRSSHSARARDHSDASRSGTRTVSFKLESED